MNTRTSTTLAIARSRKRFLSTLFRPGRLCGGRMPCNVDMGIAASFDSVQNFAGWLRFREIPRILAWNEGNMKMPGEIDAIFGQSEKI
jgi:hypothetical protein